LLDFAESSEVSESVAKAVVNVCEHLPVAKVVAITRSGYTSRLIARYRVNKDIIAVTGSEGVAGHLKLVYGVTPVVDEKLSQMGKIPRAAKLLLKKGLVKPDDLVLFTAGIYTKKTDATNLIQISRISDLS